MNQLLHVWHVSHGCSWQVVLLASIAHLSSSRTQQVNIEWWELSFPLAYFGAQWDTNTLMTSFTWLTMTPLVEIGPINGFQKFSADLWANYTVVPKDLNLQTYLLLVLALIFLLNAALLMLRPLTWQIAEGTRNRFSKTLLTVAPTIGSCVLTDDQSRISLSIWIQFLDGNLLR